MIRSDNKTEAGQRNVDGAARLAPFDALIAALQIDIGRAQQRLDAKQTNHLQRAIDISENGAAEAVSYFFQAVVPDRNGGTKTLRIPLISMRPFIQQRLVEVSVELMATIREAPVRQASGSIREPGEQPPLMLVVGPSDGNPKPRRHRVLITFRGAQPQGGGDVTIDGMPLKTIAPRGKA